MTRKCKLYLCWWQWFTWRYVYWRYVFWWQSVDLPGLVAASWAAVNQVDAVFTDMLSGCLLCEGDDNLLRLHSTNVYFISWFIEWCHVVFITLNKQTYSCNTKKHSALTFFILNIWLAQINSTCTLPLTWYIFM